MGEVRLLGAAEAAEAAEAAGGGETIGDEWEVVLPLPGTGVQLPTHGSGALLRSLLAHDGTADINTIEKGHSQPRWRARPKKEGGGGGGGGGQAVIRRWSAKTEAGEGECADGVLLGAAEGLEEGKGEEEEEEEEEAAAVAEGDWMGEVVEPAADGDEGRDERKRRRRQEREEREQEEKEYNDSNPNEYKFPGSYRRLLARPIGLRWQITTGGSAA